MSETLVTFVVAAIGVMLLCVASVMLALKTKGDRVITLSGFGVAFRVSPCCDCPVRARCESEEGSDA